MFNTLCVLIIIFGTSLIMTYLKVKGPNIIGKIIDNDSLPWIPRRQSNYTILNSTFNGLKLTLGDIPGWISCPPAVILAFKKRNQSNSFARKQLRAFGVWQLQRLRCSIIVFLHYQYRYINALLTLLALTGAQGDKMSFRVSE